MKLEGCEKIDTDPEKTWMYLSDPEKIINCVPGVIDWSVSQNVIKAKIKQGIGFIKGTFDIETVIAKNDSLKKEALLQLQGNSNLGNFRANITIYLNKLENTYSLCYAADVNVSGMIGTLSSSIIANTIKKIVKDLLNCVAEKVANL
ncbi:MAG: SRPBCC domain-containing protein [Nitrososphaeria archaeon]